MDAPVTTLASAIHHVQAYAGITVAGATDEQLADLWRAGHPHPQVRTRPATGLLVVAWRTDGVLRLHFRRAAAVGHPLLRDELAEAVELIALALVILDQRDPQEPLQLAAFADAPWPTLVRQQPRPGRLFAGSSGAP